MQVCAFTEDDSSASHGSGKSGAERAFQRTAGFTTQFNTRNLAQVFCGGSGGPNGRAKTPRGGCRLSSEALPERLKRKLGPELLQGPEPFDTANPFHVDRVCQELLQRAVVGGDSESLVLLVDLTQPHLVRGVEAVAQDIGLGMPPDDLIVALFSTLYVETAPRLPSTQHFLAWATDWMREHAEAWVRDLAMLDTPKVGARILPPEPCPDGSTVATPNGSEDDFYAHALKVCFHRLDVDSRRVLRVFDVQGLPLAEAAKQLELEPEVVEARLREARRRLAEGIANIMLGPDE